MTFGIHRASYSEEVAIHVYECETSPHAHTGIVRLVFRFFEVVTYIIVNGASLQLHCIKTVNENEVGYFMVIIGVLCTILEFYSNFELKLTLTK